MSKSRQRNLIQLLQQLAEHPAQIGNYSIPDDTGREIQFILLRNYLVAYWPDDAVKELRVVNIEEV